MCERWSPSRALYSNEKELSAATLGTADESHDRLRQSSRRERKARNAIHREFKNRQNVTVLWEVRAEVTLGRSGEEALREGTGESPGAGDTVLPEPSGRHTAEFAPGYFPGPRYTSDANTFWHTLSSIFTSILLSPAWTKVANCLLC